MLPSPAKPPPSASRRPRLGAWALMLPLLLWLAAFIVAPTVILVAYSVGRRNSIGGVVFDHLSLDNYARMFDRVYVWIFIRSVFYAAITTALCVLIGYPVAYFIGRASPTNRDRLLMLVMVPFWTSFLVRTYAWINILKEEGLLNGLLLYVHVISTPLEVLYTPWAVMIGLIYAYLPFMILPIYGSVEKLDNALIEAAFDLGATPVRAFVGVIVPLTRPGIIAGVLLVFIPALGMFAVVDILGGKRVPFIGNVIQNQFAQAGDWPFGAALGVTLLLLFVLVFWVSLRMREEE